MRIAVAYNDGMIFEHFGHCECFAIYDYENSDVNKCTKTLVDCSDKHGHAAMANLMREQKIDVVICGNMGGGCGCTANNGCGNTCGCNHDCCC